MNHASDDYAVEVRRRSLAVIPGSGVSSPPRARTVLMVLAPRLVVGLLWLFTHWFDGLFASLLWPLAGFVLLPTTLLWFSAVQHWFGDVWTIWPIMGIAVTLAIDLWAIPGVRRSSDD